MNSKVMIIDYGMGNIGSISYALDYLRVGYEVSGSRDDLEKYDAYILPGVGAFPSAMENLRRLDLVDELEKQVMGRGKAFLGICLGMQLLARDSVEQGYHKGLGWIDGHVVALRHEEGLRVPHVGWNNVSFDTGCAFFSRIGNNAEFYFDHSFCLECDRSLVVATCEYGDNIIAAIRKDNIFATQFHPEKSQRNGLKMMRNFLNHIGSSRGADDA